MKKKIVVALLSICMLCGCSEVRIPKEKDEVFQAESSVLDTENKPTIEESYSELDNKEVEQQDSEVESEENNEMIVETIRQWQYVSESEEKDFVVVKKEFYPKAFYPYEEKVLVMRMEIPSIWKYSNEKSSIDDENDLKVCQALGLIDILEEGEQLDDFDNPEDMPFPLSSSIQVIGDREYLVTEGVVEDSKMYNSRIYSYCFIEQDCLINIHFYNRGDTKANLEIYYKILQSIEIEIK